MDIEEEPNHVVDQARFWNKMDEPYGFLCLSISKGILFHLSGLKTPKDIWEHLASLYGKQDDFRVYQLENELMSLQPGNFKTLNYFFTKFKHIVLLLQQCEVKKEDDQIILAILSKIGADYSVFVSTFHAGNLTTLGWKMATLNAFIESLTSKHDNLVHMGIIISSHDQALFASGPDDSKGKGKQ